MAITINLPELGEGVDSVDVVAVLVAVGDSIEVDQGLIEVETEKASVEVPSTTAGTVTGVLVSVADVLTASAPIITLEAAEGNADDAPPEPESASAPAEGKEEETSVIESAPSPTLQRAATPRAGSRASAAVRAA